MLVSNMHRLAIVNEEGVVKSVVMLSKDIERFHIVPTDKAVTVGCVLDNGEFKTSEGHDVLSEEQMLAMAEEMKRRLMEQI